MVVSVILAAVVCAAPASGVAAAPGPPGAGGQETPPPLASVAQDGGPWSWPLSPRPKVLRAFDPPARPWLSGHRGVDLAAATAGVPVTAPAAGTVSFAGFVVDRPVITIDHGNGLRSSFEPVASTLRSGAAVARGAELGRVLLGHCGTAPCLHWGVRRDRDYLNPLGFLIDLRPSVLLPPLRPGPGRGGSG
ncbi:M23 family metallopeptidase [Arthrobacter sp. Hor0625]|uniref:M23 family metallopeptidase n=1 Tax=Arthrobacter sp. Hor0625 TaxID=3457358 RepID=UPI00403EA3F7